MQHNTVFQHVRKRATTIVGTLDHLHLVVFFQPLGECGANIAATGDHDAVIGLVDFTKLGCDLADMLLRGNKENLVIGLYYRRAFRNDGVTP